MGFVYLRKESRFWWLEYEDASGATCRASSKMEDEGSAREVLAALEKRMDALREAGLTEPEDSALTLRRYGGRFVRERQEAKIATADDDEARLTDHIYPVRMTSGQRLGDMLLTEIRRTHVKQLVHSLVKKMREEKLASRTVHHIYGVLRVLYKNAIAEELVENSPCTLRIHPTELPEKEDKDPLWRELAVYTHAEVEALISDERIPNYRRVLYALIFMTGMRIGEGLARRWRDYNPQMEPLGRLTIASSYSTKRKEEGKTKTRKTKIAPVHPTLAAVLGEWRLGGWVKDQGRVPTPDDLIVPSPGTGKHRIKKGGFLSATSSLKRLREDLATLGLRPRGQHDTRRTFISLALEDGADERWLNFIAYGPPNLKTSDMVVRYTIANWPVLCEHLGRLKISPRRNMVLPLFQTTDSGR